MEAKEKVWWQSTFRTHVNISNPLHLVAFLLRWIHIVHYLLLSHVTLPSDCCKWCLYLFIFNQFRYIIICDGNLPSVLNYARQTIDGHRNKIIQDCSRFVHFLQCPRDLQWYCGRFIILHQEEKDCVNWFDSHKECKYFFYVKDNNVLKKCHFMFRVCLFIILFSFSSVELMKHPKFWSYIYAK